MAEDQEGEILGCEEGTGQGACDRCEVRASIGRDRASGRAKVQGRMAMGSDSGKPLVAELIGRVREQLVAVVTRAMFAGYRRQRRQSVVS